jgi:hypothetical protein
MQTIEADEEQKGPPEFVLEFGTEDAITKRVSAELLFMLTFSDSKPHLWLIQFIVPKGSDITCLASTRPVSDSFVVRTCCGVIQKFRQECLFEKDALVHEAVSWFLKHGTPNPGLIWLDYDFVVSP